jgi:hypothetical protein
MALTGRYDFRKSLTGHLGLQVEYEGTRLSGLLTGKRTACHRWRAATVMDLAAPELRDLIDLRFRPRFASTKQRADPNWLIGVRQDGGPAPRALVYRPTGDSG